MKKGPTRTKTSEKRRTERSSRADKAASSGSSNTRRASASKSRADKNAEAPARYPVRSQNTKVDPDSCHHCAKNLSGEDERALFVEEEVGRIFCSESCIAAFFTPEIERLEKEFFRRLTPSDLSSEERESLAHLRWITLQEPDEVWREKTLSGDYRYTLISEFKPGSKKIWSICICLFLRGEPSFLYLAFPTKNSAMANYYRRGERVEWVRPAQADASGEAADGENAESGEGRNPSSQSKEEKLDCLADSWTEDETVLAQLNKGRSKDDIPPSEYGLYQACLEETLETPEEVWSHESQGDDPVKLYHFIKHYPDEKPGMWFVIVARETEDEEQIEIIDAFPTRDSQLVAHYRKGEQEVGQLESSSATRVVH
jgi:hypothetical protein